MEFAGGRGRPSLTLGVVLVAHVLLLLGLLRLTLLHLDAPIEDAASILLLEPADFAPHQRAAPEPEPGPAPAAAAPATASPPAAATSASNADRTAPSGEASTHSGGVTAPGWFDWFRVGESVARDRVARAAAATRPARPPFLKTPEGPRSTIFDSGKRRRAGTSEKLADGESIFWINENCYVTTDSDSITQRELHEAHKGMTRCMIPLGKRQPRGDLFDELPNHKRARRPSDATLPDARGGTGPGGVPEPIPDPPADTELEILVGGSADPGHRVKGQP